MTELRRQVRLVEVADPLRLAGPVSPVEDRLGPVQRGRAGLLVAADGIALCFENCRLRLDRGDARFGGCAAGGLGQIHRLAGGPQERGLMAHRRQDLRSERPVTGAGREAQCLDQVALGQAVHSGVVRSPARELGRLRERGQQLSSGRRIVAAVDQLGDVGVEEPDQAVADVATAELVVQRPVSRGHPAHGLDIGGPDQTLTIAGRTLVERRHQPSHRRWQEAVALKPTCRRRFRRCISPRQRSTATSIPCRQSGANSSPEGMATIACSTATPRLPVSADTSDTMADNWPPASSA
ncbi:hypothetical protein [Paractinoplanes ferrugineus]|uniref:hypothetical protein n=1 Tax=Paractinoplanes ferrugineus TaxID=113564 RepID=UPI001EF16F7A|nr:hypothetical protein [Actinoplanes ferrugineus]